MLYSELVVSVNRLSLRELGCLRVNSVNPLQYNAKVLFFCVECIKFRKVPRAERIFVSRRQLLDIIVQCVNGLTTHGDRAAGYLLVRRPA